MSDGNDFDKQQFFELFFNPEVPFGYKFWLVTITGLYTISPIDFLSEGIPFIGVLGYADDVGVIVLAAQVFTHFANKKLEEKHDAEQQQAQIIQEAPQPRQNVYSAHSAPAQPPPPTDQPPRVIQNRQRSQQLPPPNKQPLPPPAQPQQGDFLHDEWHEQLIEQKRQETAAQFDDVMQKEQREKQPPQDWDFDRNNPFKKKKK